MNQRDVEETRFDILHTFPLFCRPKEAKLGVKTFKIGAKRSHLPINHNVIVMYEKKSHKWLGIYGLDMF